MDEKKIKKLLKKLRSTGFQKKVMKVPKSVRDALRYENSISKINGHLNAEFLKSFDEDCE